MYCVLNICGHAKQYHSDSVTQVSHHSGVGALARCNIALFSIIEDSLFTGVFPDYR